MAVDENCPSNAGRQVTPNNKMLVNGSPGSHQQQQQQQQHQISTEDQSHKSINKLRIQENPLHHDEDRRYSEAICVKLPQEHSIDRFSVFRRRSRYRLAIIVAVVSLSFLIAILFYLAFFARWSSTDSELNVCLTAECVRTAASLLNAMDQSADPCDDFFQFACGSWNKKHTIPDDRSSISTFEVMADDLQVILKDVLEQPANNQDNSATIKSKTFYKSCMATDQIEEIGDKPLKDVIEELGGWPVTILSWSPPDTSLEHLLGKLRGDYNQQIILEQWVGPDDKNSSVNVIQLDQPLFGLPSREYFVKESSERERNAYLKLMIEVATIFGADRNENTEREMEDVLKMETRLANASVPEADRQDTGEIYNSMSLSELSDVVPEFDWLYYLNTFLPTKVTEDEPVVIYALQYLREMGQIIAQTDRKTVHNYAIWRFVKQMLPFLDGEYSLKRREFNKVLSGVSQERPRWNQCVDLVNKKLGMAVGALFIRDNFDPKSKETAQVMISNLREAFSELLEENAWMDKDTREVAELKANAMTERIGYPELLKNPVELSKEYETLTVHDDLFLINILNVLEFEATKNLKKLRQPVNKDRWTTEPAVVNAFYSPNKNDIVFPAGILQPLFYSQYFPKSLNYGGIGVVIGHEITHGFDDKGRQFDRDGNLKQWWNNATILRFRERAQCIIDQYSSYVLEDIGHNINGKMTQGENIADNGGLKQSYRAFKKWVSRHGNEPLLPGLNLTHDQLFFLNYAQIWCGSNRPEDALSKIRTSVHSPGPIRVLGPLSNSFDFAKAYKCPLGSRMNPNKKCSVW